MRVHQFAQEDLRPVEGCALCCRSASLRWPVCLPACSDAEVLLPLLPADAGRPLASMLTTSVNVSETSPGDIMMVMMRGEEAPVCLGHRSSLVSVASVTCFCASGEEDRRKLRERALLSYQERLSSESRRRAEGKQADSRYALRTLMKVTPPSLTRAEAGKLKQV